MTPLTKEKQTKIHNPKEGIRGNCMIACFANVLGLKIEQCPRIEELFDCTKPQGFWYDVLLLWLNKHGFKLGASSMMEDMPLDTYIFVAGESPRDSSISHQVIYLNGELEFDPHPSNQGIVGEPTRYEWLVPMEA